MAIAQITPPKGFVLDNAEPNLPKGFVLDKEIKPPSGFVLDKPSEPSLQKEAPVKTTPITEALKAVEPTTEDLEKYRQMGVKEYRSPAGKLYPLTEGTAQPFDFNLPPVADPSAPPMGITFPKPTIAKKEEPRRMQIGAAPEPTGWQKFKQFFTTDRPSLPPHAGRMAYFDRAFDIAVGSPLRVFLKYSKGKTLNIPDLVWAGIKKITPDSMWDEEVKKMNLDQAMDWASGYDPSGFEKTIGGLAEFIGRLQTASQIGTRIGLLGKTPKDISVLTKASETAKLFGLAAGFEQIVKNLAEYTEPTEAKYGAEGKEAIIRDMAIGAILSFARSGVKGIWGKLKPTEQTRALKLLGLKKGATEREIIQGARRMALKTHPDKAAGLEEKFKKVMEARELLLKGPKRDIVYRKQPPKPPALITGEAPRIAEKPAVRPPAAIKPTKPTPITPKAPKIEAEYPVEKVRASFSKYKKAMPNATEQEIVEALIEDGIRPPTNMLKKYEDLPSVQRILERDEIDRIARKAISPAAKPEAVAPTKPKLVDLGPAKEKPVEKLEALATQAQKAKAHIIAKEKAFVSEKGKMRPGYRTLAKAMTGKRSIKDMTSQEAEKFIDALNRLPEPRLVHGKLVPPSIPRTTALTKAGQFKRRFKRPTPVMFITDQSYYAEKLGVKSIVEPLEKAKVRFDLERRSAAHELDKRGELIDKVGKTTKREKIAAKAKNVPTKAREEIGQLLDTFEEAPANLDPQKKKIFDWHRNLRRTILQKQNEARAKLDMPLIKSRKAYQRHIATDIAREMLAGRYPFPEGIKFWSGLSSGKKIFNPMEFQRKLEEDIYGLFTKDPIKADKAMMYNALKEIHLTQPLKFFNAQMAAVGKDLPEYKSLSLEQKQQLQASVIPASTRRWLIDYVRTVIKGQQTQTDEWVNNLITQTGLRGLINKALHPFGRTVSQKPITRFFQTTGRMQMAGVIGTRPKLIIRNKFQLTHNLGLYTIKANVRAFLPPSSQLKKLLDESLFLKSYTGLEELPIDLAKKVEQIWHKGYQWSAISNARQAMECAYWDTLELIENPKYKNVGFADPKRTYKEPHEHLYPSEKQKILKEMEFGASATQFHYIAMGMPQVFRHKSLIPFTRLTSWWMNYYAKFHREAIHRGLSGSPSWDSNIKLPWSRRLSWLRYVILGGLILNTLGYTRSYLFGAAPTGWPPAIQFAGNLYLYLITLGSDDKWKQSKNKLAKKRMVNALWTFCPGYIAFKDVYAIWSGRKDLSSLFFYKKYKKKQEGKRKKRFERERKMLRKG